MEDTADSIHFDPCRRLCLDQDWLFIVHIHCCMVSEETRKEYIIYKSNELTYSKLL